MSRLFIGNITSFTIITGEKNLNKCMRITLKTIILFMLINIYLYMCVANIKCPIIININTFIIPFFLHLVKLS